MFLLREVFDYPYDEVARIVGRSPANCRQILVRAHAHMQEGRKRFDVSREERDEVARRFLEAWENGDTDGLVELLAPDVTLYGDGGGKAPSITKQLVGALRVAKALVGWGRMLVDQGYTHRLESVNGEPGIVFYDGEGRVAGVEVFEIADGVVLAIRAVANPDKLGHLPPR